MKKFGLLLFCSLFLFQCKAPLASFNKSGLTSEIGSKVFIENHSKNAERYIWTVNDSIKVESVNLEHIFYSSGRHKIQLEAFKGTNSSRTTSELFVNVPDDCLVKINTNKGSMVFKLLEDTPLHLKNFTKLIESGYYNGLIFHRVIDGFMIQAGGQGKRKTNVDEKVAEIPQEINTKYLHYKGALAAARMPDDVNPKKSSSGGQFYIVHGRPLTAKQIKDNEAKRIEDYSEEQKAKYLQLGGAPQLDGEYTVLGYMLSGFDVLDKIATVKTDKSDKPINEVLINNIQILN